MLAMVVAAACNGSDAQDANTDSTGADTAADTGPTPDCDQTLGRIEGALFNQTNNRFIAQVWAQYDEGQFSGSLFNGPRLTFHQEADRNGSCRLLTYDGAACDEFCDYPDICVDGECQTTPSPQTAGTLILSTSNGIEETLAPNPGDLYFRYFDSSDVAQLDWVALSMPDLDAGISLKACIPEPIVPAFDFDEALNNRADGEDVTLRWTPSALPARVYLHMTTCIGTHGGISPVEIECEGIDEGKLTIPGGFLDALDCDGCWGQGECGVHKLVRSHTVEDDIDTDGNTVQLSGQVEHGIYYYPGSDWMGEEK